MNTSPPKRILILAGETSGDMYGAAIVREMRLKSSIQLEFYGIGGDKMKAEGVELFAHVSQTAVLGFWEVMKHYGFLSGLIKTLTGLLDTRRPDLLLTIDYPGMNLRIAEQAHQRGIKTFHYICPQVWAWHKNRIPKIARILDRLVTLFPFEPALFEKHDLHVTFEGHPLADQVAETLAEPDIDLPWDQGRRIALFPGSRRNELHRILPDELAAASLLEKKIGPCSFIIPAPNAETRAMIEDMLPTLKAIPSQLAIVDGQSRHVLKQAEAALIKSGTSTLEGTLMRCPFTIVYRISFISSLIMRCVLTGISHIGLVNILARKMVCREFVQHQFKPEAVAQELEKLLTDADYRANMLEEFRTINEQIGKPGATRRVAIEALKLLSLEPIA